MKLSKRSIDEAVEAEYARVERAEAGLISAQERAWRNAWIDEQREQDRLADEAYWEQQAELEDQRRNDR